MKEETDIIDYIQMKDGSIKIITMEESKRLREEAGATPDGIILSVKLDKKRNKILEQTRWETKLGKIVEEKWNGKEFEIVKIWDSEEEYRNRD